MSLIHDTLTEASNTNLSAHAPEVGGSYVNRMFGGASNAITVAGGLGYATATGGAALYTNAKAVPPDTRSTVQQERAGMAGLHPHAVTRFQNINNYYRIGHNEYGPFWQIMRIKGGVETRAATGGGEITDGVRTMVVEHDGANIKVFINGNATPVIDYTDPDPVATGLCGAMSDGSGRLLEYTVDPLKVPSFTAQPTNQSVAAPAAATFSATPLGEESVVWQELISSVWTDLADTDNSLTITPTVTGDNGRQFRLRATNSVGSTNSDVVTLTVTGGPTGPTINTQPNNQTVTSPATATFSVAATTSGGALSYQWQRQPAGGGGFSNISGANSASFTTPATTVSGGTANNGDQYRCAVTDSNGTVNSNAATLTVNAAASGPTINTQPANQTVTTPATATFSVTATASAGALSYQWQRQPSGGGGFTNIGSATAASYTTPATAVTGGSANNGDQYRCVVSDSGGSTTSSAATLTVTAAATATLTIPVVNNTNTSLPSTTLPRVTVDRLSTGVQVLNLTDQVTDGSGNLAITSASLSAGVDYMVCAWNADGSLAMIVKATAA